MKRLGELLLVLAIPVYWWISWRFQWPAGLAIPLFWTSAVIHLVVDISMGPSNTGRVLLRRALIALDVLVILVGLVLLVPKSFWGSA